MTTTRFVRRMLALLAAATIALPGGCAPSFKRNPIPVELAQGATISGVPRARFWADEDNLSTMDGQARLAEIVDQARESGLIDAPSNWLLLSGGGANGAFSAGLLYGWSERGDRPEFNRVTGVSTGALIAPFAFLGSEYDEVIREVYTTVTTKEILKSRGLITALRSDAFTSTEPLKRLIARYVDDALVEAIAREHLRGRRLLVMTTNLDALRPVAWDIGEIAVSDNPDKVEIIRSALRASASIPAAMPPVYIQVEAAGATYDEMHVDGGATAQLYLYSGGIDAEKAIADLGVRPPTLYIIRNARISPPWQTVKPELTEIAKRTLSSLIRTQGLGDLYQAYLLSQRDGFNFRLASIPDDFNEQPAEAFDPVYMTELFERARAAARQGYQWSETPPGYRPGRNE
jgi:hypothetical protein